jgi:predicted DsbA family dithiol-disulfide isomerase
MSKLEVFFDYACPFCLRANGFLQELAPQYADLEIDWKPCEAHPRPEHGPHSDIALQGLLYALENGVDIWKFNERMYDACVRHQVNFEDVDELSEFAKDLLNEEDFRVKLGSGQYAAAQQAGNDYAYEQNGVWALPAYRMNGQKLDAVEGIGVTRKQLKDFLDMA